MSSSYQEKGTIYPSLPTVEVDIRDPNDMNKHLRLDFFNIIAEPDSSAHSSECLHTASNSVYHYSKLFIYRLLTIFASMPLMLMWGLLFGVYTFCMIWLAVPMRRLVQSMITESSIYMQTISDVLIAPLYRSFGMVWSNIRLSLVNQTIYSTKQVQV